MSDNACVLIDYENFFLGREKNTPGGDYRLGGTAVSDIEALMTFVSDIVGDERRLIFCRAYADYNARRQRRSGSGNGNTDYYLQRVPRMLMEAGIEPIQVFRLSGHDKNAADIRMAMDATAQISVRDGVDHYILVTGDADFVPLVLELKRLGAHTTVIGVQGATATLMQRFCDDFFLFEEHIAPAGDDGTTVVDISHVKEALQALLRRRGSLKFAGVRPLLSKQLGVSFDPTLFDCETMGDFLRERKDELGVRLARGVHDWEVSLSGSIAPVPATDAVETAAIGPQLGHTTGMYKALLSRRMPKVYVFDKDMSDMLLEHLFNQSTQQVNDGIVYKDILGAEAVAWADEQGIEDAQRKVDATLFQLYKAGCYVSLSGPTEGRTDFHWSEPARLHPEIASLENMRHKIWTFVCRLLGERLATQGTGEVQLESLVGLLLGRNPDENAVRELELIVSSATTI